MVERVVLVSAGEMAVQRVDRQAVERIDLGWPQTEPVHACVDHHVAGTVGRDLLPARDLFDGVQARPRSNRPRCLRIVRSDAVKHHQADALRQIAQRLGFGPGRHEKVAAARLDQRFGRLARAEAIAVGFHRRARRHPGIILRASASSTGSLARSIGQAQGAVHRRRRNRANPARRGSPWPVPNSAPSNCSTASSGDCIEAVRVYAPSIGMRSRLIEALHPAVATEEMLGGAGPEAIAGQCIASGHQLELLDAGP